MRRAKGITSTETAQHGATSVRSMVIRRPISALIKVKSRIRSGDGAPDVFFPWKDRLIAVSFLFVAAAVTLGWMIGLAWGAITLAEWLFS